MSRFWRGLIVGGVVGVVMALWMNRRRQPPTLKERVMKSASRTATRAQRSMGNIIQTSRKRATDLMPSRK